MKQTKRIITAILITVMVFSIALTAFAASGTWKKNSKGWWYSYTSGGYAANQWEYISGKWYHFDNDGYMETGWIKDSGKWYYLGTDGVMTTGWQKVSGKWYYMDSSGAMQTGWVKSGGKWYYLGTDGVMTTGWQKVSGKWYYMDSSGVMQTGWVKSGGKWYYLGTNGVMQTGWQKIGGKWYYFKSSGVMVTGTQTIGGKTYYFGSNGVWQSGSGSSSANAGEAAQAFIDVLNSSSVFDFMPWGNSINRTVAIIDINTDGIPELIFPSYVKTSQYAYSAEMEIWTFANGKAGKAGTPYSVSWVGAAGFHRLFYRMKDGSLCYVAKYGDEYLSKIVFTWYTCNSSGKLLINKQTTFENKVHQNSSEWTYDIYQNGVLKKSGIRESVLNTTIEQMAGFSGNVSALVSQLYGIPNNNPYSYEGMTKSEAIAYLKSLK